MRKYLVYEVENLINGKKIKKEELDNWRSKGWVRGRKINKK